MVLDFFLPEHDRKLIPEGRISGPMPWVIAIMLFLTLLSAAVGLLLLSAAQQGGDDLARRVTVQIIEPDPVARTAQSAAVAKELRRQREIVRVETVPDKEVRRLLEPWLGGDVVDADIPVPALIELTFAKRPGPAQLAAIENKLSRLAPAHKMATQVTWMTPFFELMTTLLWLSLAILFMLLMATSATVVLAVRSALNSHRQTIEIMHMMGGTDLQAARLFQRRVGLDALLGGLVGFGAAALVIWMLAGQFAQVEPGLLSGAAIAWYGWVVLTLIPLAVTALAMLIARMTVISALRKMV